MRVLPLCRIDSLKVDPCIVKRALQVIYKISLNKTNLIIHEDTNGFTPAKLHSNEYNHRHIIVAVMYSSASLDQCLPETRAKLARHKCDQQASEWTYPLIVLRRRIYTLYRTRLLITKVTVENGI